MIINKIQEYYIRNKPFGSLIEVSPTNHIDQNSQPLETEDRINLAMVIK